MKYPRLSIAVLISTSNLRPCLFDCLNHIKNQTRLPNHLVIIETIQGTSITSKSMLAKMFPKNIRITYEKLSKGNISVSRNRALRCVREDIILFIDDDVLMDKHYIKDLLKIYETRPNINSVVGRILPSNQEYWQIFINRLITASVLDLDKQQPVEHWPTLNFSIRKSCLQHSKLKFNEKYSALEDMDLCLRLKLAGYLINYFPHLSVKHKYQSTMVGFIKTFSNYFRNARQFNHDHANRHLFNLDIFYMPKTPKITDYFKLIKRVAVESNIFRQQLHLPGKYYFACLCFYYSLYIGQKNTNSNL